jgi:flagellar FliJ protein
MNLKGFKFSLEAPLKVKKLHRAQLEVKLAKAKKKMDALKRALDLLTMESDGLQSKLADLLAGGTKVVDLKELSKYLSVLSDRIADMQEQYRETSDRFAALRNSLIDIIHEIDVLEELKEKQIKEFLKEVQRKEEKALEERINFQTFMRGGKTYG